MRDLIFNLQFSAFSEINDGENFLVNFILKIRGRNSHTDYGKTN